MKSFVALLILSLVAAASAKSVVQNTSPDVNQMGPTTPLPAPHVNDAIINTMDSLAAECKRGQGKPKPDNPDAEPNRQRKPKKKDDDDEQ